MCDPVLDILKTCRVQQYQNNTPSEYITVQGVGSGLLVVKALT